MAEAGHSDLNVDLVTVNGTAGMIESAQVFAQQAKAAGITINVKVMEVGAYLAKYTEWPFGVDFLADTYLSIAARSLMPGGPFNISRFDDKEFNALYQVAITTPDMAKRCDAIDKMRQIEYDRGGNVIWGFANVLNGYRSNVHGLVPYSVESPLYNLRQAWMS